MTPSAQVPQSSAGESLPWACSEPWATINVNAAGDVRPCCFNDQVMGNLAEQSFEATWNGRDYQQMRADHLALRVPESCAQCARNGRVKRSAFLAPRPPVGTVPFRPARRARLLAPADGELIAGPLVVAGELPRAGSPLPPRARLPELWMDGALLVRLRDYAVIVGHRFAAAIAIPGVTQGAHVLSLAPPRPPDRPAAASSSDEAGAWDHRRLQIGRLGGEAADPAVYAQYQIPPAPATLTAVARLALALPLGGEEPAPALHVGGKRHPLATWLCGPHAEHWLGVAVIDVDSLAPGSYPLELRLRRQPPFRRRLVRLAAAPR